MNRCLVCVLCLLMNVSLVFGQDRSYGPFRVNAARGRGQFTRQSSTRPGGPPAYHSFLAVDGNTRTTPNYCSSSAGRDTINWWSVNLGKMYLVYKVHIVSADISSPLKDFRINYYREEDLDLKSNGLVTWFDNIWWLDLKCNEQTSGQAPRTVMSYPCTPIPPVAARWIVVRQEVRFPGYFVLCEVEVEADRTCTPFTLSSTKGTAEYHLPEDRLTNIPRFFDEHRTALMENPPHGTIVTYTCKPGYSLRNGAASALCEPGGTWNATLRCEACQNGYFGLNCNTTCGHCKNNVACNFIDGSCAECQPGYELPTCLMGVNCGTPDPVSFAELVTMPQSTLYQDVAQFRCIAGYVWANENADGTVMCQADGTWSEVNECIMVDCGDPPEPYNHVSVDPLMVTRTTLGGMAYYDCGTGYTSDESLTRECQEDGTWSGRDVICELVDCGAPPDPIDGPPDSSVTVVVGGTSNQRYEAIYSCGTGFTTDNSLTRNCQPNGQWSGQTPTCSRRVCPMLPHPAFGQVTLPSVNREYQSLASYSCISGFQLQGNSERQCDANGEWTNEEPVCREIDECASNPCGAHGQCTDEIDSYQCGCVQGYMGVNCMQVVDGCVENSNPCSNQGTCFPQSGTGYTCQCMPGYTGDNCDLILTCEDEMTSSDVLDVGEGVTLFSASIDYVVQYRSRLVGSNLTYSCGTGWLTDDPPVRYCVPDEQGGVNWNGSAPNCYPVSCGRPPQVRNGQVEQNRDYSYSEQAVYTCERGYTTSDVTRLTCDENGRWHPSNPPSCRPINCGTPPTPNALPGAQSSFSYSGTTYGYNATYNCGEGFVEIGEKVLVCLYTGLWSDNAPFCARVACNELPDTSDANVVIESFTGVDYGKKVRFNCKQGHITDDHLELECLATGEWSHDTPRCTPIDCGPLYSIPNGNIEVESTVFGSVATYECDAGFQISAGGSSRRVCEASGAWRGLEPTCEALVYCVPGLCLNGGNCTNRGDGFLCLCKKGFEGRKCEINVNCAGIPCWNGGTCFITEDYYVCRCSQGFTGDRCQDLDDSPCISAPCRNRGTCVSRSTSSYTCKCTEGFNGTNCEFDWLARNPEDTAGQRDSNLGDPDNKSSGNYSLSWWWVLLVFFIVADVLGLVILLLVLNNKKRRNLQEQEMVVEKDSSDDSSDKTQEAPQPAAKKPRRLSLGTNESAVTKTTENTAETGMSRLSGVTSETGFTGSTAATTLDTGVTGSTLVTAESDTTEMTVVSGEYSIFNQSAVSQEGVFSVTGGNASGTDIDHRKSSDRM